MSTSTHAITADELFHNYPPQRCELVRGKVRYMVAVGPRHGIVTMNIAGPLLSIVKPLIRPSAIFSSAGEK